MKRMVFVALLGIGATAGLCADPPPPAPVLVQGSALPLATEFLQPSAAMARLNRKGQVVLKVWTTRSIPLTATRILREGKEVKEKHTFYEWVSDWEEQTYEPKDIKLLGSDGKPLDKKLLPEILKKERAVLFTYGDGKIDSVFLKVIKEGTPILQLPNPGPS